MYYTVDIVALVLVHHGNLSNHHQIIHVHQAGDPGPFPAFQCCMLKSSFIEKLGMGLGTRLRSVYFVSSHSEIVADLFIDDS